jgi:DNA-binding transcriptional LysR family regulator
VLEDVETARHAARTSAGGVDGRVTIGFSAVLNHRALPPLTRAVRQRYPHVELTLLGRVMTRDAIGQLDSGAIDLAFVGLPVTSPSVTARLIGREPYGVVLPLDHRLASESEIDLGDLADDGFVTTPLSAGSALQEGAIGSIRGRGGADDLRRRGRHAARHGVRATQG